MQWIDINLQQPQVAGKYVVKTKTTMGFTRKLEANYSISNGKGSFNVSNQKVTDWLLEDSKLKYTAEDIKQFGLFLGNNFKQFKNKTINEIFNLFTQ